MNYPEADIALVEKYFDAELSEPEMKLFVSRLESDESFKLLVEQEKTLVGAIRFHGITENLKFLQGVEASLQAGDRLRPGNRKVWYFAAAAAIVGIAILSRVWVNTFAPTSNQLFEADFTPYPNVFEPTVRSQSSTPETQRVEAFQAYEQQDYQKAAALFQDLLVTRAEPGILLLLGNSNLILGNIDEAKKNFTTLNQDFDDLDMQAMWYLSLCYLKGGEVARARQILKELGETEISYATKAKELLKKVN